MIPKGHEVAGLGRRFAAYVLDLAPVLVLELVLFGVLQVWASPAVLLVVGIVSVMLSLAYGLYQWWAYATTGAGLGARLVGVELVGLVDGKPLGWWRVFLRFLVFVGLGATGVGGIAMLIFLVVHERRQGWHDMAVKAIVVQPKAVAEHERAEHSPKRNHVRTVGMPPHLAQQFSPEAQPQMTSEYTTQSSFAPQAEQPFFPGPGGFSQPVEPANTFPPAQPGFGGAGTFPPAQSGGFGASSFPAPQSSAPSVGSSFPAPQSSAPSVGSSFPAPQSSAPSVGSSFPAPQSSAPSVGSSFPAPQSSAPSVGSSFPAPQPSAPSVGSSFPAPQPSAPSVGSSFPAPQPSAPSVGSSFPAPQPSADFRDESAFEVPTFGSRGSHPDWIPMPTPASVLEPSNRSVKVRQREFGEVEDADSTVLSVAPQHAPAPGDHEWCIRLDDGREVGLNVTVLLGRNPQRSPEDPEVHLVPASGDGRMISRTHVLIGTDARGVFVVDRGSTNGTALVLPSGEMEPAPAGVQMRVKEGQQVRYGDRWFTVLARPPRH